MSTATWLWYPSPSSELDRVIAACGKRRIFIWASLPEALLRQDLENLNQQLSSFQQPIWRSPSRVRNELESPCVSSALSFIGGVHIGARALHALQRQNTEFSKQIFPEKEYRGLGPKFHIHASVSDWYISTIGLPILLEEICRPILGLYKSLTDTWMLKLGLSPRYSQKRNT